MIAAPATDEVRVEGERITVLFPMDAIIVNGEIEPRGFLFVEPEEDEAGNLTDVQFSLARQGETAAWFDMDLATARKFFEAGLDLVRRIEIGEAV